MSSQDLSLAKFTFSVFGIYVVHQKEFIFECFQIGNCPKQWLVQKNNKKKLNYFHVFIMGSKPNSCYFTYFNCQCNKRVGLFPAFLSNSSKGSFSKKTECQWEVLVYKVDFKKNSEFLSFLVPLSLGTNFSCRSQEKVAVFTVQRFTLWQAISEWTENALMPNYLLRQCLDSQQL